MERAEIQEIVKEAVWSEFGAVLEDISWRIKQTYDLLDRAEAKITGSARSDGKIYVEDLNILQHALTGYAVTNATPNATAISWTDLHIVYSGTDYTITNSSTSNKYVYWDSSVSTTVLQTSNTKPVLDPGDVLVFVNNGGNAVVAMGSSMPPAIANNTVDSGAILANAVTSAAIGPNAVTAGAVADGAINRSTLLGSNVVSAGALADGAINRAAIHGANTVAAGAIADGAINRSTLLGSNVVAAGAIADGAVNRAALLGTNVVAGTAVQPGALNATKLSTLQHLFY